MRTLEKAIEEILPEKIELTASEWGHIESQLRKYCEEIIDECAYTWLHEPYPIREKSIDTIKKQL